MTSFLSRVLIAASIAAVFTPPAFAQARDKRVDSLQLSGLRLRAEATDSCVGVILASGKAPNSEYPAGTTNVQVSTTPHAIRSWIDSATAYRSRTPARARAERVRYAWIPFTIGIERIITDRTDAYSFIVTGYSFTISAREVPMIAGFLDSAATRTIRLSSGRKCPADRPN
jgi:hypothetical protein